MPVNCVIERNIPGTLYLPTYWAESHWVGITKTISYMVEQPFWYGNKDRLYALKHGNIWKTEGGMWRLNTGSGDDIKHFISSVGKYFVNFKGQWVESMSQTIVTAEAVTHHELYLEELFQL